MYTDDQIAKLLKNLGELYAENARLNLVNEVLQDNYNKLVESYDKVTNKPEQKLFKEEKQKSKLDEQILAIQNKLKENL